MKHLGVAPAPRPIVAGLLLWAASGRHVRAKPAAPRRTFRVAVLLPWLFCCTAPICAQESAPPTAEPAASAPPPAHSGDFWQRDALIGNLGGSRSALEDAGVLIGADSIDEVLGNVAGGVRHGAIYEGRLELLATIDLEKTLAWPNATFHVNAYQIRGRGLSANDLGNNLLVASNIEATRSTRLFDLWLEQVLWNGALAVRAGQIAADDEFYISQYAANFINSTFGWPAILAVDLPSGGPAYPLATPGVRVKLAASDQLSLQAAVFNGDPAGPGKGDPQRRDASGTAFRIGDGAFAIAEASLARNQAKDAGGLPAAYKLGGWFHSGSFADQRFDTAGQSLAAPASTGNPARHPHDYGLYLVLDQAVWRKPDAANRGVGVFLRLAWAPPDRNLIALYGDAGINVKGLFPGRDDDVLGLGVAAAKISDRARAVDADARRFTGVAAPIRDGEAALEATYRFQVTPWWAVQPDLQFIFHPGGNAALPDHGTRAIPNAAVLGLRSSIIF